MIRPFISYCLTAIILLSQTGLPLHMHYCKGMLESVSVFFNAACNEDEETADIPACCQKMAMASCEKEVSCCDDEITVLLQDFDSLLPQFDKWDQSMAYEHSIYIPFNANSENHSPEVVSNQRSNSGPPIYIRFHSLIYYA